MRSASMMSVSSSAIRMRWDGAPDMPLFKNWGPIVTSAKSSLVGEPHLVVLERRPELLVVGRHGLTLAGVGRRDVELDRGEVLLHLLDSERRAGPGALLLLLGLEGLVREGERGLVGDHPLPGRLYLPLRGGDGQ